MRQLIFCSLLLLILSRETSGLQKESDHFIFYFEAPDSSIIDSIEPRLEGCYNRITGDLKLNVSGKTGVHVYPTLQEFHNAIGRPDAPDWLVGVGWTEIHVVSPLNPGPAHSYEDIMDNVFIHEFTHVCTAKINQNIPIWLNEGFACYEGGPFYSKASVNAAYEKLGRIPSLDELNSSFDNFANLGGYPFSLTISTFIAQGYGMEKLSEFIRSPADFTIFSGLTKSGFQDLWFQYVKINYLGISFAPRIIDLNNFLGFHLDQNFPNPFNPSTCISFSIPGDSYIRIIVFDALGKEISLLIDEEKSAGSYTLDFTAGDLSSGIYYYQIKAGKFIQTKKMILMK